MNGVWLKMMFHLNKFLIIINMVEVKEEQWLQNIVLWIVNFVSIPTSIIRFNSK